MRQINNHGINFLMFDEYAWFGPCFANDHDHRLPSTPSEHVTAVYELMKSVRQNYPDMLVEVHDPVWSWGPRYLPVYYRQGFGEKACYQENWGFEFMWDCLGDLKKGKAKALYYYAMATDIPLYLHISMIPDNDECLFFWWAASTVRHLGIGGKYHNYDLKLRKKYCPNPETRWNAYKKAMKLYKSLKQYFVQGKFHGLHEEVHLHTLNGQPGGVINLFNISEESRQIEVCIPSEKLQIKPNEKVQTNCELTTEWIDGNFCIRAHLPPASPKIITVGKAFEKLNR